MGTVNAAAGRNAGLLLRVQDKRLQRQNADKQK